MKKDQKPVRGIKAEEIKVAKSPRVRITIRRPTGTAQPKLVPGTAKAISLDGDFVPLSGVLGELNECSSVLRKLMVGRNRKADPSLDVYLRVPAESLVLMIGADGRQGALTGEADGEKGAESDIDEKSKILLSNFENARDAAAALIDAERHGSVSKEVLEAVLAQAENPDLVMRMLAGFRSMHIETNIRSATEALELPAEGLTQREFPSTQTVVIHGCELSGVQNVRERMLTVKYEVMVIDIEANVTRGSGEAVLQVEQPQLLSVLVAYSLTTGRKFSCAASLVRPWKGVSFYRVSALPVAELVDWLADWSAGTDLTSFKVPEAEQLNLRLE